MTPQRRLTDILFWLTGPVAALVLLCFGLYFWGRRRFGHTALQYPWALLVGLPMAIGNVGYNVIFATFVFQKLPPLRNAEGRISPYFTTRLNHYRRRGESARLVNYLVAAINEFDPGHFADIEAGAHAPHNRT